MILDIHSTNIATLKKKIENRDAKIGVIGVGYVGLTLSVQLANKGFEVLTIDKDHFKIDQINKGNSYIEDVSNEELYSLVKKNKISASLNMDIISSYDVLIICVPTPLTVNREPDISYIEEVSHIISKYIRPGQLIILESTTYPGTTNEVILPILNKSNLEVGKDYFLAHSPERVDFGNKMHTRVNIPKVVGGVTSQCLEAALTLYKQIVEVIPVSSSTVAEMVKLFENTYRSVNIGLVNELAMLCNRMGINVWEMLDAAFTKPYGIQSFYPGPGVGGHCIPIDPFYLVWKAREYDFSLKFVELAGEINSNMPYFILEKLTYLLNHNNKTLKGSNILILGVAYKKDISDYRNSPAIKIIELLKKSNASVSYHDPLVPEMKLSSKDGHTLYSLDLSVNNLNTIDAVIIATDHSAFDLDYIVENSCLVLDTRNATRKLKNKEKITYL
ncbi:nucleotide sugar dehydrogenase [Priestia megaterium]|nr:nucleotide sugar dehydrogenase [Priestia megaterium]